MCETTPALQKTGASVKQVVITIVAILAAVAVPSYHEYIQRSYRSEAQAYLMTIAARQQQFLLDIRGFSVAILDSIVSQPRNVATAYSVTMATDGGPPPTFMPTATPTAAQASERCGALTLDQTGTKTAAVAEMSPSVLPPHQWSRPSSPSTSTDASLPPAHSCR